MNRIFLFVILMGLGPVAVAQQGLKVNKQQTRFFYAQANLHAGFMNDAFGQRWDCADQGPQNQVALQWFGKNQSKLQRGYVPLISLNQWKIRFSVSYDHWVGFLGRGDASAAVQLFDAVLQFDTKWDRTTVKLGYAPLPYGHSPKIDPISCFIPGIMNVDLGMSRDVGVFLRTPVSKNADLEIALTSGGMLSGPLLSMINLARNEGVNTLPRELMLIDPFPLNTWLVSGRVGSAPFKANEFGFLGMAGTINGVLLGDNLNSMYRGGGEWVFKYKEKFKLINQITAGQTLTPLDEVYNSLNYFTGADLFINRRMIWSLAYSYSTHYDAENDVRENRPAIFNSFSYAFTPHTRLRLNQYLRYNSITEQENWGVFLQFVTGIGRRP
jgi:hypothetical protein